MSEVTVERVGATWPVVKHDGRTRPASLAYCGHCGADAELSGDPATECHFCHCALSGEVPQSKVADFLRQDGE